MVGHLLIYKDEVSPKVWDSYLALPNYELLNSGEDTEHIKFITVPSDEAVNDNVLYKMMVNDLQENREFCEAEAIAKIDIVGEGIVSAMWDAYSKELELINPIEPREATEEDYADDEEDSR